MIGSLGSISRTGVVWAALVCVFVASPAQGQQRSATATLQAAKKAAAAGRHDEAVKLADEVLAKAPANHDAAAIKIGSLAAKGDRAAALKAYDRYFDAAHQHDGGLLAPIGQLELRSLSASELAFIKIAALEARATSGDRTARAALAKMVPDEQTDGGFAATEALARLGDQTAVQRLQTLAGDPQSPSRIGAIQALAEARVATAGPLLLEALKDRAVPVRAAAADALGRLKIRAAVADLKTAMADPVYLVKLSAAVALKRIGDPAGDEIVKAALTSPIHDAQVVAARAYVGDRDKTWIGSIKPLLKDNNSLTRVYAAELLLGEEPAAALFVLGKAIEDPNPVLRAEAARVLGANAGSNVSLIRTLLEDTDPTVRLHVALGITGAPGL